ncbi:glycosyltransferase family 4 protein [Oxalobacteraceae bacterium A2-2]
MDILLINHYAGSPRHGMEFRPYYLARAWTLAGHRVRIVAAAHTHLRARQPELGRAARLDQEIDGIAYRWYSAPSYQGNGLRRACNMAAFLAALHRDRRALAAERPQLVIASSTYPADIWSAHAIARRCGARLVYELHDLWPLTPMQLGGMPAYHPFIRWLQAAEDHACRHAQRVISLLPHAGPHLAAHGLDLRRLHVIPNGVDLDGWRRRAALPAAVQELLDGLRRRGPVLGYAGSHGAANALGTLLDAAVRLRHEPLSLVLAGDGPDKEALRRRALREGLGQVHFLDPLPRAAVPTLLAQLDMAYLGWPRSMLYRYGIAPNKLGDYMLAGLPVVHAVEAANDPVAETGCGLSVPPADPAALAAAIQTLLRMGPAQRHAMGQRGARHARTHLDYTVLAQRFLDACAGPDYGAMP